MKRLHIIGRHNAGKTRLLIRLVPALKARGLRVGILKHAPGLKDFEGDTDSAHFAEIGTDFLVLAGNNAGAIYLPEMNSIAEWEQVLKHLMPKVDLLLVEGYKSFPGAKIEVWHDGLPESPISGAQEPPLFFVSHTAILPGVPTFAPDDVDSIADNICRWWQS